MDKSVRSVWREDVIQTRARSAIALIIAAIVLCSCSVTISAGSDNLVKEQQYDARWNAGWEEIARNLKPLAATSTSPGVCNVGGSQQGCYDTDIKLIAGYTLLSHELTGSTVPPEFAKANDTVLRGIADAIQGLSERNAVISAQTPNGTFAQSNRHLDDAQALFKKAMAQFTGPDEPMNPFN